jgi:hypothetical protein
VRFARARASGEVTHRVRVHRGEHGDDRAALQMRQDAAVGQELAQLAVVADADQDRFAFARQRGGIAAPLPAALLRLAAPARVDVVHAHVEALAREMADDGRAHAAGSYDTYRSNHRFLVAHG